jgi:hypothetical protein
MIAETFACRRLENLWPPPGARHNLLLGDNSSGGHGEPENTHREQLHLDMWFCTATRYVSIDQEIPHIPEIQMLEVLKPKSVKQNIGKVSQVRHSLLR